ncbi:hypothetical protein D9M69_417630 [compost metagenome]
MTAAMLRQSVFNAGNSVGPDEVTLALQRGDEVMVDLVLGYIWNVFHGDQLRLNAFYESFESVEQRPFTVVASIASLVIARERLARCAACQQLDASGAIPVCYLFY